MCYLVIFRPSILSISMLRFKYFSSTLIRFDVEELERPLNTVGIFLGYMSGPLYPETPEEQQRRLAGFSLLLEVILHEAL